MGRADGNPAKKYSRRRVGREFDGIVASLGVGAERYDDIKLEELKGGAPNFLSGPPARESEPGWLDRHKQTLIAAGVIVVSLAAFTVLAVQEGSSPTPNPAVTETPITPSVDDGTTPPTPGPLPGS